MRRHEVQVRVLVEINTAHLAVRIGGCDEGIYTVGGEGVAGEGEYGNREEDVDYDTQTVRALTNVI